MEAASSTRVGPVPAILALCAVGFVLWRGWVCDDAFITFRHVLNLLAGDGPVFNVGERVQGFSHPLWFGLLSVGALFGDVYAAAVTLGLMLTAALFMTLGRHLQAGSGGTAVFLLVSTALLSSKTFVEYQTSGLENALTNFLLILLAIVVLRAAARGQAPSAPAVILLCALLISNRVDHVALCGPVLAVAVCGAVRTRRWAMILKSLAGLAPAAAWCAFATVYYGTPLPNTYYAKAALPLARGLQQGGLYFADFARHEPLSAAIIAIVLLVGGIAFVRDLFHRRPQAVWPAALWFGLVLHIGASLAVGGDFMRGRFLLTHLVGCVVLGGFLLDRRASQTVLLQLLSRYATVGLLALCAVKLVAEGGAARWDASAIAWIAPIVALAAVLEFQRRRRAPPSVPLLLAAGITVAAMASLFDLDPRSITTRGGVTPAGLEDEWSLFAAADPWENRFREPTRHRSARPDSWRSRGRAARAYAAAHGPIALWDGAIGKVGFHAGRDVVILDRFGLTDAFIARLPADPNSRVGHIRRAIPMEYFVLRGALNPILEETGLELDGLSPQPAEEARRRAAAAVAWPDDELRRKYEFVTRMIAGPLFDPERLRDIPAFARPRP